MALSMSCLWWLYTLFNKSWDKSLMIGFNLEWFANSTANVEHVTLYFDNWVDKMGHCQWFSMGYFCSIVNTCTSKWTCNGKLKLKFCASREKIKGLWRADAQECQPCLESSLLGNVCVWREILEFCIEKHVTIVGKLASFLWLLYVPCLKLIRS